MGRNLPARQAAALTSAVLAAVLMAAPAEARGDGTAGAAAPLAPLGAVVLSEPAGRLVYGGPRKTAAARSLPVSVLVTLPALPLARSEELIFGLDTRAILMRPLVDRVLVRFEFERAYAVQPYVGATIPIRKDGENSLQHLQSGARASVIGPQVGVAVRF